MTKCFLVSGARGQLGSSIISLLRATGRPFYEITISDQTRNNTKTISEICRDFDDIVFIHCAAKLWPKSAQDRWLNTDAPREMLDILKSTGKPYLFAYVSSTNVNIPDLQDAYTQSKRRAEEKLPEQDVIVFRPDLIWGTGTKSKHQRQLRKAIFRFFGINLMFYPGAGHYYCPVHPDSIAKTIIANCHDAARGTSITIVGDTTMHIFELIKKSFGPDLKIIDLTLGIEKFFPDALKRLLLKSRYFQQVVKLDRSKFNTQLAPTNRPHTTIKHTFAT